ncbi:hypothetical protein ACIREE_40535 [Streptomyces sp. NPDC102467]|uniref:hypothetical protein n=1 Tax=Streptomyces sp. NPDC102467 TaxID=3366179 RepID=UPI0038237F85
MLSTISVAADRAASSTTTEIRAHLPAQGTDGRGRYLSGKSKQYAVEVLVVTDH